MPTELLLLVGGTLSIPDLYNFLSASDRLPSALASLLRNLVAQDEGGTGVLRWAAEHGHAPLAELAISVGADIHKPYDSEGGISNYHNRNPLEWAALYGHSDVIRILCKHGARLDACDTYLRIPEPLHLATLQGGLEAIRVLLDLGAEMMRMNNDGESPAFLAARGSVDCMKAFIDAGFDLNTNGPAYETVLHPAVQNPNIEMVEYLLGYKEPMMAINAQDCDGHTALHLAIVNSEIVKLLLRHGADMKVQDRHGLTPVHRAACGGIQGLDPESLRVFIDAGVRGPVRRVGR